MKAIEMVEGPEAFTRFTDAMRAIMSVPHSRVQQLVEQHKKEASQNPRKRGPKRKVKPPASPGPAAAE